MRYLKKPSTVFCLILVLGLGTLANYAPVLSGAAPFTYLELLDEETTFKWARKAWEQEDQEIKTVFPMQIGKDPYTGEMRTRPEDNYYYTESSHHLGSLLYSHWPTLTAWPFTLPDTQKQVYNFGASYHSASGARQDYSIYFDVNSAQHITHIHHGGGIVGGLFFYAPPPPRYIQWLQLLSMAKHDVQVGMYKGKGRYIPDSGGGYPFSVRAPDLSKLVQAPTSFINFLGTDVTRADLEEWVETAQGFTAMTEGRPFVFIINDTHVPDYTKPNYAKKYNPQDYSKAYKQALVHNMEAYRTFIQEHMHYYAGKLAGKPVQKKPVPPVLSLPQQGQQTIQDLQNYTDYLADQWTPVPGEFIWDMFQKKYAPPYNSPMEMLEEQKKYRYDEYLKRYYNDEEKATIKWAFARYKALYFNPVPRTRLLEN